MMQRQSAKEGVILLFVTTKTYQKRKGVIDEYS